MSIYRTIELLLFVPLLVGCTSVDNAPLRPVDWEADVSHDVVYKSVNGRDLCLDIYKPLDGVHNRRPAVVYVHGGGWCAGDKGQLTDNVSLYMLKELLNNGFAVFSIDYRLLDTVSVHLPDPVADCKDAVRWIRLNADSLSVDPQTIGLWGESAGAHLALVSAYSFNHEFMGDTLLSEVSSEVAYVIDAYGPTNLVPLLKPNADWLEAFMAEMMIPDKKEIRDVKLRAIVGTSHLNRNEFFYACERYSPTELVSILSVPTLIVHGDVDQLIPFDQAKELAGVLSKKGVLCHLIEVKNGEQGLRNISEQTARSVALSSVMFIQSVLAQKEPRSYERSSNTFELTNVID